MQAVHVLEIDSLVGRIRIVGDGLAIRAIRILARAESSSGGLSGSADAVLIRAAEQLEEYFAGTRWEFDVPLAPVGTPFQHAVWGRIARIPWGHAMSYGRLGAELGLEANAARAVGTAVGANPITIAIPCHRVLAGDGRITGYSGGDGIPTKQLLLDHEGIPYR